MPEPKRITPEIEKTYKPWHCPICTAGCTFEAMTMCCDKQCPVMEGNYAVLVVDGCDYEFISLEEE